MVGGYFGPGWGGWVAMTLALLAFWALVIFGGMALYRMLRGSHARSQDARRGAEQILDERLAHGEIDIEEYTRRRDLLRSRG